MAVSGDPLWIEREQALISDAGGGMVPAIAEQPSTKPHRLRIVGHQIEGDAGAGERRVTAILTQPLFGAAAMGQGKLGGGRVAFRSIGQQHSRPAAHPHSALMVESHHNTSALVYFDMFLTRIFVFSTNRIG
jgi:hypothetical protein